MSSQLVDDLNKLANGGNLPSPAKAVSRVLTVFEDVRPVCEHIVKAGLCFDMKDDTLEKLCAIAGDDIVSKMACVQRSARRILKVIGTK